MNLSSNEIKNRRSELKRSLASYPADPNGCVTDQLEADIIDGCGGNKLRQAIEYHTTHAPELKISYDDLIKSAVVFGNLPAVVELWGHLNSSQRKAIAFTGESWELAVKYRHTHIVEYFIKNCSLPEYFAIRALKDLAPWASLNTLTLATEKYPPTPSMCASALLEACSNPREDVMRFLANLSGGECLKKMQYGIANPQIAELFDDAENVQKVRVFNDFVEKMVFSGDPRPKSLTAVLKNL